MSFAKNLCVTNRGGGKNKNKKINKRKSLEAFLKGGGGGGGGGNDYAFSTILIFTFLIFFDIFFSVAARQTVFTMYSFVLSMLDFCNDRSGKPSSV